MGDPTTPTSQQLLESARGSIFLQYCYASDTWDRLPFCRVPFVHFLTTAFLCLSFVCAGTIARLTELWAICATCDARHRGLMDGAACQARQSRQRGEFFIPGEMLNGLTNRGCLLNTPSVAEAYRSSAVVGIARVTPSHHPPGLVSSTACLPSANDCCALGVTVFLMSSLATKMAISSCYRAISKGEFIHLAATVTIGKRALLEF